MYKAKSMYKTKIGECIHLMGAANDHFYRIAGKFGEEFNLTNWRHQTQIANLKSSLTFLTQSSYTHIRTMQYESAK